MFNGQPVCWGWPPSEKVKLIVRRFRAFSEDAVYEILYSITRDTVLILKKFEKVWKRRNINKQRYKISE